MAIDARGMLLQLNPMHGVDLSRVGERSIQRQNLALMREKFEEEKRYNKEQAELRRLSEAGEMRRAEMTAENQRRQAEAAAAEKRRAEAATAYSDFHKAANANDFAGMTLAGQRLREFGGFAEEGPADAQGRPSWRVGMEGDARNQRLAERDAVTQQMKTQAPEGSVWLPPDVSQQATLSKLNALGLGNLDSEGLIDMGEQADTRATQFGPVLDSIVKSRPGGAYQESARHAGEAAMGLGLSPTDTADAFLKLQAPSDTAVGKELDAVRDVEKLQFQADTDFKKAELAAQRDFDKEMRAAKTDRAKQAVAAAKDGYSNAATLWKEAGLEGVLDSAKQQEMIEFVLTNNNPNDDSQIGHMFLKLKGSIGAQSNQEMDEVFGTKDMSAVDLIGAKVRNLLFGGQSELIKKSLLDIIKRGVEENDQKVFSYLDRMEQVLSSKETAEEAKRGWRQFRDLVPEEYRESWNDFRAAEGLPTYEGSPEPEAEEAPMQGTPVKADLHTGITADDEFMDVFTEHAINAGIDPELVLPLIGHESGGNPQARNSQSGASGLIQFLDSTAKRYGFESAAEFGKLSAAEQAPYIVQYLVDSGVTGEHDQGDIYVAISAPAALNKPDDHEVYKKGTDEYRMNQTWDLDNDGVITRGELHRWGMGERRGKASKGEKPAKESAAESGRDDDESLLE